MAHHHLEDSFGNLLEDLTRSELGRVTSGALGAFAQQLWYGDQDLVPVLESEVSGRLRGAAQKQRALYLVDRLRRFPCLTDAKAARLKEFVSSWSTLKPAVHSAQSTQMVTSHKLDKLAYEWGLEEDVVPQMKDVLEFQTRHFAATTGAQTGYVRQDERAERPRLVAR
ncbi:hypothetical protein HBO23_33210 [Pseudomonas sp. WS 5532]|uniref:hypothetical protein n=1 Tax=Pseudomonas sp. WS 5532 TaxID=2717495 RepID=UPI0014766F3A|nr:hypothetical protein [Pseudomonas sp. WS 5532]NMX77829.1 hypothetical protein [Pseudomonas sp. WS 5532]